MLELYVRVRHGLPQMVRRFFQEESGLSMIEYGVMAAFVIAGLAILFIAVGPQLKDWMGSSICSIMGKTYKGGSGSMCA